MVTVNEVALVAVPPGVVTARGPVVAAAGSVPWIAVAEGRLSWAEAIESGKVHASGERTDLSAWRHGHCPCCGWEPDFAVITPSADRRLICGRCAAQWSFGTHTCPFCSNDDRSLITSFATRDGRYRVYACDVCRRYLKAYDGRGAARPVMVSVDSIATLPLDAAAIQKGYVG